MKLDAIDFNIIAALQQQGRTTNVDLARANELAPSSMLERVRRLEERGVITGYRATLDPKALGFQVEAMVMVTLNRHKAGAIDQFESGVQSVPEVKSGCHLAGRYDYVLHVVARDIDHLGDLVKHELGRLGGVEKLETFLILSTIKPDAGYSLQPLSAERG
jgi:Lrp/AsnC family leucine-responsive transcriptional regulator